MKNYIIALLAFGKCFLWGCMSFDSFRATDAPPQMTETATEQDGWQQVVRGLAHRVYIPDDNPLAQLIALRIDPQYATFRVHYQPGEPMSLQAWRSTLPDADIIINANFFTPQNTALGLLVSDGVVHGQSYTDRGGTFGILNGVPVMQSNIHEPYQGELYQQAVQGFPMLVRNGQAAFTDARYPERSRRTVIGMDTQGQIIIMATPGIGPSLPDLSAYLATTDIGFDIAFNLDGGGSTMMYAPAANVNFASLDPVPAVLAVYLLEE